MKTQIISLQILTVFLIVQTNTFAQKGDISLYGSILNSTSINSGAAAGAIFSYNTTKVFHLNYSIEMAEISDKRLNDSVIILLAIPKIGCRLVIPKSKLFFFANIGYTFSLTNNSKSINGISVEPGLGYSFPITKTGNILTSLSFTSLTKKQPTVNWIALTLGYNFRANYSKMYKRKH